MHQLWVRLTQDPRENHGFAADVEVEVPDDFAERVALCYADQEARGVAPVLSNLVLNPLGPRCAGDPRRRADRRVVHRLGYRGDRPQDDKAIECIG